MTISCEANAYNERQRAERPKACHECHGLGIVFIHWTSYGFEGREQANSGKHPCPKCRAKGTQREEIADE